MLRSRANTLVSVRRVTERNAGRLTAGVDGEVVLTPEAKMQLVDRIQHRAEPFKAHAGQAGVHPQAREPQAPTIRDSDGHAYHEVVQAAFGFVGRHSSVSSAPRRAA